MVGEPDPYSSVVQSIMWPCVARLQTVWALPWQDTGLTELSTASYLAIVLCPGLKCASTMADMTQDISSKARLGVKVVLACPRARNIEPSEFIFAWSNFVYSHSVIRNSKITAVSLDACDYYASLLFIVTMKT